MKSMVHMSWGARWCDLLSSTMMCWVHQSEWLISESSNTVYESQRMNSQNRLNQKQTNYFSVIIESFLCFLVISSNCSGGWVLLDCHFRDRQFTKWAFLFILISAFLSLISQRSVVHSLSFIFWKWSFYLMRFFHESWHSPSNVCKCSGWSCKRYGALTKCPNVLWRGQGYKRLLTFSLLVSLYSRDTVCYSTQWKLWFSILP